MVLIIRSCSNRRRFRGHHDLLYCHRLHGERRRGRLLVRTRAICISLSAICLRMRLSDEVEAISQSVDSRPFIPAMAPVNQASLSRSGALFCSLSLSISFYHCAFISSAGESIYFGCATADSCRVHDVLIENCYLHDNQNAVSGSRTQ